MCALECGHPSPPPLQSNAHKSHHGHLHDFSEKRTVKDVLQTERRRQGFGEMTSNPVSGVIHLLRWATAASNTLPADGSRVVGWADTSALISLQGC